MIRTILLKGYYGFGNFGDDLLFVVSWRWLRKTFPNADIKVCTESPAPEYLGGLIGEPATVVRNEENVTADLIFHGGGGTYFDFRQGPAGFSVLNFLIRLLGRRVYDTVQRWRGRTRVKGRIRAGVGIGIGQYTGSSRRFPFDFVELGEFDLLAVRDPESLKQIAKLGVAVRTIMASDLVFLVSSWVPANLPAPVPGKLGIVLRDWAYDDHAHQESVAQVVDQLIKRGYSVTFFSFDAGDEVYKARFSSRGEWIPWIPGQVPMTEFIKVFSTCSAVVASRAHGVLAAACLGIPVVCLEIESKLQQVAAMVPHLVARVASPFPPDVIVDAVLHLPSRSSDQAAPTEIGENARKVLAALDQVSELAAEGGKQ